MILLEFNKPEPSEVKYRALFRALNLAERSSSGVPEVDFTKGLEVAAAYQKLVAWQAQPPFNQASKFKPRLKPAGLSQKDLLALLAEEADALKNRIVTGKDWPGWLLWTQILLDNRESEMPPAFPGFSLSKAKKAAPYLALVWPVLDPILKQMQGYIRELLDTYKAKELPFDLSLIQTLLLPLLPGKLAYQMHRTVTLEVNLARLKGQLVGETGEERFQDYMRQLSTKAGFEAFLEEYPVLTRLLMTSLAQWAANSLELLERLSQDWEDICATFFPGQVPGKLVEITGEAGDSHRAGRSVHFLKFSSGLKLVYKPHSLAVDLHFQKLLEWFNGLNEFLPFRTLGILDRKAYGWAEFVEPAECQSQKEVERFYQRQGAFLALLYALEATDFHYENVLASGEHPVMIDLEGLFHPRLSNEVEDGLLTSAADLDERARVHSVFRVGLLPQKVWGDRASAGVDISGLGGRPNQLFSIKIPTFEEEWTDQMRVVRKQLKIESGNNRPLLKGLQADPGDYYEHFSSGFSRFYRLLLNRREQLLRGPLQAFWQDEVRVIFRPTTTYAHLLQESYHPDFMRDALDRDRFFDHLWLVVKRQPEFSLLISHEQKDLWAGDIPIFTTRVNSREVYSGQGQCLAGMLGLSGWEACLELLNRLSPADLKYQLKFIEAAFSPDQ